MFNHLQDIFLSQLLVYLIDIFTITNKSAYSFGINNLSTMTSVRNNQTQTVYIPVIQLDLIYDVNKMLQYVKEFLNGCFFNRSKIFSKCSKFVEGMAHLCGRVGLFGKIENDGISLEKIDLFNDVILDMIVDITLVDVKHHPKVYDLTVPSTLNFGLANGLQVRDTANSGYVQRKMVKVFEDLQVKYDGTVRGSNDWISEWQYGGDGFDRTCCAVKNGESFFCDVDNIANRLNNEHELGM